MEIAVIGVNHNLAPIDIREQVAFTESQKITASHRLLEQGFDEVVILSTCNRSEVYLCGKDLASKQASLMQFFQSHSSAPNMADFLFLKRGEEAINHLFKVAAGLDSVVLGEDQILGQIKLAYENARQLGASKKILNRLFQTAIGAAKEAKAKTKMSENPLSISRIAVQYLKEQTETLQGRNILLIGTGEMSRLALNYLILEEVSTVYIASRNHEKKKELIKDIPQATLINYDLRYDYLDQVDLVLSATASPHFVLTYEKTPELRKPLTMMDIALPRDVDPRLNEKEGITVYNLDRLQEIRLENESKREKLAKVAGQILEKHAKEFTSWLGSVGVDHTIASLKDQCDLIKEESMAFLLRKIDFTDKQKRLVDSVMMNALGQLMRGPILHLKQLTSEEEQADCLQVVQQLFQINEEEQII